MFQQVLLIQHNHLISRSIKFQKRFHDQKKNSKLLNRKKKNNPFTVDQLLASREGWGGV